MSMLQEKIILDSNYQTTIALERTKKKLKKIMKKQPTDFEAPTIVKKRKREWFEKFRWFYSSEGFLVVGGRDATTNEILIKKHTDKDDLVFHTDAINAIFATPPFNDEG